MGNKIANTPISSELEGGELVVNATQEINPDALSQISNYHDQPGKDVVHEITEGYEGGKISQTRGVSSPSLGQRGSVYFRARGDVVKQSGKTYTDTQGNTTYFF